MTKVLVILYIIGCCYYFKTFMVQAEKYINCIDFKIRKNCNLQNSFETEIEKTQNLIDITTLR